MIYSVDKRINSLFKTMLRGNGFKIIKQHVTHKTIKCRVDPPGRKRVEKNTGRKRVDAGRNRVDSSPGRNRVDAGRKRVDSL